MGFAKPWRPRAADSIATHWVLHPIADSININNQVWEMYFRNLIPRLVKKGDDGNCGSTAFCDTICLQAEALVRSMFDCRMYNRSGKKSPED
ncbi:chorismate mutase 1, chloroplastic-like [Hibiscus syriacus]|uniref:chorismate mutase 1, chloroplastic-like n=1 Tax=Hibiscus syriacus TaxID=106335 RepID=UPI00192129F4|nr:chorismate mutase 1, chloroplastic-like [Hibiscus syriacus]